ncbi:MAG: phage baseplate protein [Gammaproteobacteria bacterium]|nr:phage baseplate protein [Gammaproteobacteria bacterium]
MMPPVEESSLLKLLEQGLDQPAYKRALLLLAAADAEVGSDDDLASIAIGQRDRRLLLLRERLFGSGMECTVGCPGCGESLEFSCAVADLCLDQLPSPGESLDLTQGEFTVRYRLPNSHDLQWVLENAGEGEGQARLLQRCIQRVTERGRDVTGQPLPESLLAALLEGMEQADPQGNMELDLTCPACAKRWQSPFDIVAYLWTELEAWGQRLLGDIHVLASAYGWTENEILAVSPWRRRHYLERVTQ